MLGNLTGWHFLIILVVVLLLFGSTKLPALARSVGQSMRIFKSEVKTDIAEAPSTEPEPEPTRPVESGPSATVRST